MIIVTYGTEFVIINNAKFAKRRYFWTFQEDIDKNDSFPDD